MVVATCEFVTVWEIIMLHACVNSEYELGGMLVAAVITYVLNTSLLFAVYRYSTTSTYPLQSCTYTRS